MDDIDSKDIYEGLISSFSHYYDIEELCDADFRAKAVFSSHGSQYFVSRNIKTGEVFSHETVYFVIEPLLSKERLSQLCDKAWDKALGEFTPFPGHRSSDVALILIADRVELPANEIRKKKRFKSYSLMFRGSSRLCLAVIDRSTGEAFFNRPGERYKNPVQNVLDRVKSAIPEAGNRS
ncbi:MAG: hypothetical protein ILP10_01535 [Lachnospiraceae bacterium]|nr:hypothetical protein [Lachnospiraceae bacterium]